MSYDQLADAARQVFRRLAAVSGRDFDAVLAAVAGEVPLEVAWDALDEDGSGWQGVHDHLTADGYRVAVVQNPTFSLDGDVAATRQVLDSLDGPAVLVGHSYGGVVITEAGNAEPSPRIWIRMRRPRLPGAGDWRWSSSGPGRAWTHARPGKPARPLTPEP
jgi:hypothetical protein